MGIDSVILDFLLSGMKAALLNILEWSNEDFTHDQERRSLV